MDDTLVMTKYYCAQNLLHHLNSLCLCKPLLLDDLVEELTSCAKLGNDVQVVNIFEVFINVKDVWMVKLA